MTVSSNVAMCAECRVLCLCVCFDERRLSIVEQTTHFSRSAIGITHFPYTYTRTFRVYGIFVEFCSNTHQTELYAYILTIIIVYIRRSGEMMNNKYKRICLYVCGLSTSPLPSQKKKRIFSPSPKEHCCICAEMTVGRLSITNS